MTQWRLDEEVRVGPISLRGRVYLPAHQPGLAEGGRVSERYIAYHRQRAKAGVAMQVTGATPVAPSVEWADICLWNIDESVVPGYRRLAEAVHAEGGRMLAQLAHPGPTEHEGVEVIGASLDLSEVTRQLAVPATAAQLARIIDDYAAAADRCRRGDLDGVEISMAHGLLLASFLSPLTNRRDDEFGGDAERRLELPRRVLSAVRETLGHDRVLGIRLGCDDLVAGGLAPGDAAHIAAALEPQVDYISVMVGNNNRLEARVRHWPPTPAPEGLFRGVARTIREAVDVPVAAVGRVKTLDLANDIVAAGDADLVGIVRAHIATPSSSPRPAPAAPPTSDLASGSTTAPTVCSPAARWAAWSTPTPATPPPRPLCPRPPSSGTPPRSSEPARPGWRRPAASPSAAAASRCSNAPTASAAR